MSPRSVSTAYTSPLGVEVIDIQTLFPAFCATKEFIYPPSALTPPTLESFEIVTFPASPPLSVLPLPPFAITSVIFEAEIVISPPIPPTPFVLLLPLTLTEFVNPEIVMFCIVRFVYASAPSVSVPVEVAVTPVLALASIAMSPVPDIV